MRGRPQTRAQQRAAGTKKRTLFDNVNTTTANGSLRAPRWRTPHSRVPDERRRSRSEDPGPGSFTAESMEVETSVVWPLGPGSRFARPGHENASRPHRNQTPSRQATLELL